MLIDRNYFVGDLDIPNRGTAAVGERIDYFIVNNEETLLTDVLGYSLYKAFTAGIAAGSPAQKWLDLKDGAEYTDLAGKLTKWYGIIRTIPISNTTVKKSFIANKVYYEYMKMNATQTTGTGEALPAKQNAVNARPDAKMCAAWNEMVDWIYQMIYFIQSKPDVYPEWLLHDNMYGITRQFRYTNQYGI